MPPPNSVHVIVSTICRISFVCAQARIETKLRSAIGAGDLTGVAYTEVNVRVILWRFIANALELWHQCVRLALRFRYETSDNFPSAARGLGALSMT